MGMWDFEAWDNDSAADWFGDLMDETNLRGKWLETISSKDEGHSEKRATVWLFAQLGRVYIWPIENYDSDLELAIKVGEEITESEWLNEEAPPYIEKLKADVEILKGRRK
ncbi:MAG: hypothetical protein GY714_20415 [Desulfobacterales bacterium]|nr:hypothetical protein [Desulfobacterales bacterium]